MMRPKLILIEGLPGSGKTTTAELVHDIAAEMNLNAQLFLEGNLEHPADYDGVASFTKNEFDALWYSHPELRTLLDNKIIKQDDHYFLHYRKIINEYGSDFPDEWLQAIVKNDIYELSLQENRKLITDRWRSFTKNALQGSDTFIFECCFIQNPATIGLIKHGAQRGDVISYVKELATVVEQLNPLLIYVDQNELDTSFRKAVKERPVEWSEGFIDYYTNQGYGKQQGYKGLEGTLQVLKARKELEEIIFNDLNLAKVKVNNSSYDRDNYKQVLRGILSAYLPSFRSDR